MDPEFFNRHLARVEQIFLALKDCLAEQWAAACDPVLEALGEDLPLEEKLLGLNLALGATLKVIANEHILEQKEGPLIDHQCSVQDLEEQCGLEARLACLADDLPEQLVRLGRVRIFEFLIEALGRLDAVPSRIIFLATRSADSPSSDSDKGDAPPPTVIWN